MKISFLTTIFPMPEQYLIDFFNSLNNQTYKDFDVIVVNDRYENFEKLKQKFKNLNIVELPYSNTPAKNREYGINYCKDKKYDVLIFGDSDDYFSENRVEKNLELLQINDIVVNDLTTFDDNGIMVKKYISHRINNRTIIKCGFIEDKNIFGFTNTALNINILDTIQFNEDIIAVDWFMYKRLLENIDAIFTNETLTFYRQYKNNIIGLVNNKKFKLWWEK